MVSADGTLLESSGAEKSITVNPGEQIFTTVAVGSSEFINSYTATMRAFKLSLVGTFPNPFMSRVIFRYMLPATTMDYVSFGIYDMRGRLVWKKVLTNEYKPGLSQLTWNGLDNTGNSTSAGMYVLRMSARETHSQRPLVFETRLTKAF
jgi:hypothetical protein